jgi:hypothetical protein
VCAHTACSQVLAERFAATGGAVWEWESRAELDASLVQGLLHLESAEPRYLRSTL